MSDEGESSDDGYIHNYGGRGGSIGGSDDDDDNLAFFGFDDGGGADKARHRPKDGFEYATPGASDAEDEEYDAAYARQTRAALMRLIDEADEALFGETTEAAAASASPSPPHLAECSEWRSAFGCLRVRGTAALSTASGALVEHPTAPTARGGEPAAEEGAEASVSAELRSNMTRSHRSVISARDRTYASYKMHYAARVKEINAACERTLSEERQWTANWKKLVGRIAIEPIDE